MGISESMRVWGGLVFLPTAATGGPDGLMCYNPNFNVHNGLPDNHSHNLLMGARAYEDYSFNCFSC